MGVSYRLKKRLGALRGGGRDICMMRAGTQELLVVANMLASRRILYNFFHPPSLGGEDSHVGNKCCGL